MRDHSKDHRDVRAILSTRRSPVSSDTNDLELNWPRRGANQACLTEPPIHPPTSRWIRAESGAVLSASQALKMGRRLLGNPARLS